MADERKRKFAILFYQEHLDIVRDYLTKYYNLGVIKYYTFNHHEPDNEEGQPHYHCAIDYYNAHSKRAVSKKMQIDERFVKYCSDWRLFNRYLLHLDDPDKKRYYPKNVCTSDMEVFREIITAQNDNQITNDKIFLRKAFKLIDSYEGHSYADIIKILALDKDISAITLRKYNMLLKDYFYSAIYNAPNERAAEYVTRKQVEADELWRKFINQAKEKGVKVDEY